MNEKHELLKLHNEYKDSFKQVEENNEFAQKFYQSFLSGNNTLYQKYVKETKNFDEEWIKTVESYVPSLNKIVLTPKSSLRIEEDVVAIEKAKKINSNSIRHLSANTHMIKDVTKEGLVIPSKILTSFAEIDYGIYENRFIMTLIQRLFVFVRNRYELIKSNIESFEKRHFNLTSTFPINETTVEYNVDVKFVDNLDNIKLNEYNKNLLARVEYLNKVLTNLRSSQFMEKMKNQRKVHPPIMKTNIITKDVNYRNAYLLWLFLDRYNTLAFTIDVKEKQLTFSSEYYDDIYRQALTLFTTIASNQEEQNEKYLSLPEKSYRKKSIKIKKTHPDDFDLNIEDEQLEDQSLNEYYLAANKRLFKQSYEYHKSQSKTYETSVKRALRETLDISNALYQSFFELDDEEDIFKMLITEIDVTKELTEARRKALISKMIREVKEVDFNNALRQEKKYLDDIAKYDGLLLKETKAQTKLRKKDIALIKRTEKDKKKALLQKKQKDEMLNNNKKLSNEMNEYRKEVNKEILLYKNELKKLEKLELSKYSQELNLENKEALNVLKKKFSESKKVSKQKLIKEKALLEANFKKQKQKIDLEHKNRLKREKEKINKIKQKELQVRKDKINKDLLTNKKNIEKLEEMKLDYQEKIKEYKNTKKEM